MKKILTLIIVASLSLVAFAQTSIAKPQAMKTLMAKERLSTAIKAVQQPARPEAKLVTSTQQAQFSAQVPYAAAKAPAELEVIELYFPKFADDPLFYPLDTVVSRNGDTIVTGGDWLFTVKNERYQFNFDIYNYNPETMAGTYTVDDLDLYFSSCFHPEAPNNTCYYKTCNLTITEEKVGDFYVKYTVEADIVSTLGVGGEENGAFKIYAEHQVMKPQSKMDVAILDCVVEPEEDRFRIYGKNDTMDVDLTFFTETGVEGYYTHKMLDDENYKLVHRGTSYEIAKLEGMIISAETVTGGVAYVFMFEALTTNAHFFNVAMEAPVVPTDTIEFTCNNAIIDDTYGASDATITISANNGQYEVLAGYNATKITTPAVYSGASAMVYLDDLSTPNQTEGSMDMEIASMQSTIKIDGNKKDGYTVEIEMIGNDHKYYIIHLSYGVPEIQKVVELNFPTSAKAMYYIDHLGLQELQLANYTEEYSVSFDILRINQVMGGEFVKTDLFEDQTFIIHHEVKDGEVYDTKVPVAEIGGSIMQENDTTFLTATVVGFDSVQYNISMFYAVPTPTKTVTYTFDGLGYDEVIFTNAISEGAFILEATSEDADLMAKVQVERITTGSIEGTFINDGQFEQNDFNAGETYVQVWDYATEEYITVNVQKGTMTLTVDDNQIITAVASFICDDAVQYDLTFKTEYEREHLAFDSEEGEVDYTYAPNSYYEFTTDYVESHNQLYFDILAADYSNVTAMVFFVDHMDSEITVPEGVYPINKSMALGTVYASPGVAVGGGPIQSYFCYTIVQEDGIYYDQEGLYCLVDGTVTVKKVDGKLSIDVDAHNSYDLPVKLHYNAAATAVEDITAGNTNTFKCIINGQLVIIRNGETYNANGAKL
ncbi:MAG: acid shock protein [Paludibacteraceae bacterium]|nr:acid shock protein [Paludibacteraceae bacterium]